MTLNYKLGLMVLVASFVMFYSPILYAVLKARKQNLSRKHPKP